MPLFGTPSLTNFPIAVRVSENCYKKPDTFISVIAHELSHILLHSLLHPQKDNEIYTDLTAMISGFNTIMGSGRRDIKVTSDGSMTQTLTTTYGYLSDEQFQFAQDQIKMILKRYRDIKHKLNSEIEELHHQCTKSKNTLSLFKQLLEYLDSHRGRAIKKRDLNQIVLFHQSGYTHELKKIIIETEKYLANVPVSYINLEHYSNNALSQVQNYRDQMEMLRTRMIKIRDVINNDVEVLKRNVGFWFRISLARDKKKV